MQRRIKIILENSKLENLWKEGAIRNFSFYPDICWTDKHRLANQRTLTREELTVGLSNIGLFTTTILTTRPLTTRMLTTGLTTTQLPTTDC